MALLEELAKLNPNKYDKRSADLIRAWKDRVPHLDAIKDYVAHPVTQELAQTAREQIARINQKLQEEDLLLNPNRSAERAAFLGEKRAHQLYLALFTRNA